MEPIILNTSEVLTLTDDELLRLCATNRNLRIERDRDGNLIIMSPSGSNTSRQNSILNLQLGIWNRERGLGEVFDSNGGFVLPNGAMRAPDAAWIPTERWQQFSPEEQEKFLPLCPDFVIELLSPTDRLADAQAKMQEWMENGCRLAWLIDPVEEQVFIYRRNVQPSRVDSFDDVLSGEDVLPGFTLTLEALR